MGSSQYSVLLTFLAQSEVDTLVSLHLFLQKTPHESGLQERIFLRIFSETSRRISDIRQISLKNECYSAQSADNLFQNLSKNPLSYDYLWRESNFQNVIGIFLFHGGEKMNVFSKMYFHYYYSYNQVLNYSSI